MGGETIICFPLVQAGISNLFFKVNPAPYVMAPKAEDELDPLNKADVIKSVALLDWVAPIVPVLKRSYHQ